MQFWNLFDKKLTDHLSVFLTYANAITQDAEVWYLSVLIPNKCHFTDVNYNAQIFYK
jgi:hypothetical protein